MKSFKEFFFSFSDPLTEAIQFNHGAKYGQIVILAGGSGSGKGFIKDWMLDINNFKVRDTDSFKTKFLGLLKQKSQNNNNLSNDNLKQCIFSIIY